METDIKIEPRSNHVHLPVYIGDKEYNFTLDTGAVATTIDPRIIENLGLEIYATSKDGIVKPKIPHKYSRLPSLSVGSITVENHEVIVSDLPRLLDNSAGGLHSVLGYSTLKNFIMTLNYKTKKFKLEKAIQRDISNCYSFEYLNETHLIVIPVHINGVGPYPFVLDTGAGGTVITQDFAETLGLKPMGGVKVIGKGVGGESPASMSLVDEFSFQDTTFSNFMLIAMDLDKVSNRKGLLKHGVLGYNFLKHFEIIIDYPNKRIALIYE